jgi:hypothetical protein
MKRREVYQQPYVKIYIDEDVPAIYEDWIGEVTSEEFLETMEAKLSIYQVFKTQYPDLQWVMDIRQLKGVENKDLVWASQEFYPRLYPAGIRKFAFVLPPSAYLGLSDEQFLGKMDAKGELMLGYFESYQSAATWLCN